MVKKNIENFKLDRAAGGALPCVYKWGWSTLTLQRGQTNSCHRTQNFAITPKNFKNFHNTQGKINARQSMLRSQAFSYLSFSKCLSNRSNSTKKSAFGK